MPPSDESSGLPADFSGRVRLFPLPDLVMFPHVVQPLHIFEPRYLEMLRDSLADDQMIAMSLLQPGWETEYHGRPRVAEVACLGKVVSHAPTDGGGQNILLLGLKRVAIQTELPPVRSYRQADVTVLEDDYRKHNDAARSRLQRDLLESFRDFIPESAAANEQFEQLLSSGVSLGTLTDIVAFTLDVPMADKQDLLSDPNVDARAEKLLEHLARDCDAPPNRTFPPSFSDN